MGFELLMRAQSEVEPVLEDPREGEETETSEKGDEAGETKREQATHLTMDPREGEETEKVQEDPSSLVIRADLTALGPREGDETETSERGGGAKRWAFAAEGDPRPGDETTPIRESPLGPPVRT